MSIAVNRTSLADLRQPVPGRGCGPRIMEMITTDDRQKPFPAFSAPPPPMHRMQPPDGIPHGPPVYESFRSPYAPSYDGHPAEQRRASTALHPPTQPPMHSPTYPPIPNRELPQPQPHPNDVPYGRQGSLPGSSHTPSDAGPSHFRPTNGTAHDPSPHSAPAEYRARLSFQPPEPHSNGDPAPLPPHSLPPTTQYPTPVPHISHTPAPYESGSYYQSPGYNMRNQRRATRAQQACDQCRARKAKCDEGRPACSHCKENSLVCIYKEVPPHKQEKTTQVLLDRLQAMEDKLDERISQMQGAQTEHTLTLTKVSSEIRFHSKQAAVTGATDSKSTVQQLLKPDVAPDALQKTDFKDENGTVVAAANQDLDTTNAAIHEEALQVGSDGELSIPVEHTTAAHKLLMWPSIRNLLLPHEYDDDYVMKLEEDRGLIRVYGRGEGDDTSEDEPPAQTLPIKSNTEWEGSYSQGTSPSGPWGAANHSNGVAIRLLDTGVDEFGIVTSDPETIRRNHESYLEHIHKLHPFLDQNDLQMKMDMFVKMYCPSSNSTIALASAEDLSHGINRGLKRKRSCETLQGAGCDVQSPSTEIADRSGRRHIARSIDNAIILLVLALGSICGYRNQPIPGPVTKVAPDYMKERIPGPTARNNPSPVPEPLAPPPDSIYPSKSFSFQSPSLTDTQRNSRSQSYPNNQELRNIDVIPGLAYYAYATQILGCLQGGNRLKHVQAALLAGLYTGQLAHPFQSHGWIFQAARACQLLVRSKRYEQMKDGPQKDLYDFAYWTCLQLESDILAELDLPASGISRSEGRIALPKGQFILSLPNEISAPSTMMMFFYSAQIHLRKVLNRVHTDLYKVEKQGQSRWSSTVQEILSMNLEMWRNSLPMAMRWRDADPPSKDINVARMRAKYYGARYIIHRPLLYHALHYAGHPEARSVSIDSPTGSAISGPMSQQMSPSMTHSQRTTNMARMSSDMGPVGRSVPPTQPQPDQLWTPHSFRDLPQKLRRACRVCIDSAILSTQAFDGIEGRPVVTNIFGTAHAQFGNMLVLSATYMSNLSELVDRNDVERLLRRTINFLLQSRYISPSLRADAKILTQIYIKIFGEAPGPFTGS